MLNASAPSSSSATSTSASDHDIQPRKIGQVTIQPLIQKENGDFKVSTVQDILEADATLSIIEVMNQIKPEFIGIPSTLGTQRPVRYATHVIGTLGPIYRLPVTVRVWITNPIATQAYAVEFDTAYRDQRIRPFDIASSVSGNERLSFSFTQDKGWCAKLHEDQVAPFFINLSEVKEIAQLQIQYTHITNLAQLTVQHSINFGEATAREYVEYCRSGERDLEILHRIRSAVKNQWTAQVYHHEIPPRTVAESTLHFQEKAWKKLLKSIRQRDASQWPLESNPTEALENYKPSLDQTHLMVYPLGYYDRCWAPAVAAIYYLAPFLDWPIIKAFIACCNKHGIKPLSIHDAILRFHFHPCKPEICVESFNPPEADQQVEYGFLIRRKCIQHHADEDEYCKLVLEKLKQMPNMIPTKMTTEPKECDPCYLVAGQPVEFNEIMSSIESQETGLPIQRVDQFQERSIEATQEKLKPGNDIPVISISENDNDRGYVQVTHNHSIEKILLPDPKGKAASYRTYKNEPVILRNGEPLNDVILDQGKAASRDPTIKALLANCQPIQAATAQNCTLQLRVPQMDPNPGPSRFPEPEGFAMDATKSPCKQIREPRPPPLKQRSTMDLSYPNFRGIFPPKHRFNLDMSYSSIRGQLVTSTHLEEQKVWFKMTNDIIVRATNPEFNNFTNIEYLLPIVRHILDQPILHHCINIMETESSLTPRFNEIHSFVLPPGLRYNFEVGNRMHSMSHVNVRYNWVHPYDQTHDRKSKDYLRVELVVKNATQLTLTVLVSALTMTLAAANQPEASAVAYREEYRPANHVEPLVDRRPQNDASATWTQIIQAQSGGWYSDHNASQVDSPMRETTSQSSSSSEPFEVINATSPMDLTQR